MKSSTHQSHWAGLYQSVGFALALTFLPFAFLQASPLVENGDQCWSADEYVAKRGIDQAGAAQIREIQRIIEKVGSIPIPHITPPLAICDTKDRIGQGAFVTNRREPLRVTTGMLKILGSDEDMMAAIIGHEISHLSLNHLETRKSTDPIFQSDANRVAHVVMNQYEDVDKAKHAYSVTYRGESAAFIRNQETEADLKGIGLATKAGFNPEGAQRFYLAMLESGDKPYAGFLDDHPGMYERYKGSSSTVLDEKFDQVASKLANQQKWRELNATVKHWLSALPESPNAWYYEAKLHRGLKSKELEDLENTFTYSKPSLSKRQVEIDQAMLTMCLDLYSQEYIVESANCSRSLSDSNREQFNKRTFRGMLIVGTNEPAPINLAFVKDKDRGEVITNGDWPKIINGPETPAWKPIRFEQQR